MDQHEAFLADICERPDDDTPRLIYADFLDDNGDPTRAAFIRLQCELARLPSGDERRAALTDREWEMWWAHRPRFLAELPDLPSVYWGTSFGLRDVPFERGFISGLRADTLADVRAHWDVLRLQAPIRAIGLQHLEPAEAATLGGPDDPPGLAQLHLGEGNAGLLQALAASPLARRLTALDLSHARMRQVTVDVEVLASEPAFAGLRRLHLDNCFLSTGARGVTEALAGSPVLAGLTDLSLKMNGLGDDDALALASSPYLLRLECLELDNNHIGPAGARAFVEGPDRPGLTHFSLGSNHLGDEGASILSAWAGLARFRRLDLANNQLGADFVESLAHQGTLAEVERLELIVCTHRGRVLRPAYLSAANNKLTEEGLALLLRSPHRGPLAELSLWSSALMQEAYLRLETFFRGDDRVR